VSVVPAVSGFARGLVVPGLRLSELIIGGVSALILLTVRGRGRWGAFDWLALAYVVATAGLGTLGLVRRGAPFDLDNVGALLGPLQFLLLYRAVVVALPSEPQRRTALRWMILASVPVSALAILQQYDLAGARQLVVTLTGTDIFSTTTSGLLGSPETTPRATGPFPHWHDLGGYLMTIVLLAFGLLLEGSGRVLRPRALVLIAIPAFVALTQTVSIAPILGVIAGVLIIGFQSRRSRHLLGWAAVVALASAIAFAPLLESRVGQQFDRPQAQSSLVPQTLAYRYHVWQQFVPVIGRNAVAGYGPDLPPNLFFPYSESLYVDLMLRGGLPLLAIYVGLMWALARRARETAHGADPDRRVVGRVVFTLVVILVFIHLIASYFLDSGPPHLLWALAGMLGTDVALRRSATPASVPR
jgi:hypothetical protein